MGKIIFFALHLIKKLLFDLKTRWAIALSEKRHTSQKYKAFPVFLLENVKQLTHNSYLEANLVPFAPVSPKGSYLC